MAEVKLVTISEERLEYERTTVKTESGEPMYHVYGKSFGQYVPVSKAGGAHPIPYVMRTITAPTGLKAAETNVQYNKRQQAKIAQGGQGSGLDGLTTAEIIQAVQIARGLKGAK